MTRPPSFLSFQPGTRTTRGSAKRTAQGVTDYLRADDKMAALLPAVKRMAALQQDCRAVLPAVFDVCSVVQFDAGQLVFSIPNAALAARLKQQLPKLQEALLQRGWQVSAIRLKVQLRKLVERPRPVKQLKLPSQALSALASLRESLEDSPQNEALKAALEAMVKRHRGER
ncbi:DciA family protein [Noviherbaspirillum sp. CPCC 100848]|uniref:DciA family protein n=1 Tax=Noviherbaspirillum album TaxID=3080276 RepID=A0ABU6J705_9BURK|nr:DciA family protein [Noviherbaspirillum sp. CPCC 100848]MEC4719196.1 DciA family protein [Noviherbaspirillum sp. CPCC 100848]